MRTVNPDISSFCDFCIAMGDTYNSGHLHQLIEAYKHKLHMFCDYENVDSLFLFVFKELADTNITNDRKIVIDELIQVLTDELYQLLPTLESVSNIGSLLAMYIYREPDRRASEDNFPANKLYNIVFENDAYLLYTLKSDIIQSKLLESITIDPEANASYINARSGINKIESLATLAVYYMHAYKVNEIDLCVNNLYDSTKANSIATNDMCSRYDCVEFISTFIHKLSYLRPYHPPIENNNAVGSMIYEIISLKNRYADKSDIDKVLKSSYIYASRIFKAITPNMYSNAVDSDVKILMDLYVNELSYDRFLDNSVYLLSRFLSGNPMFKMYKEDNFPYAGPFDREQFISFIEEQAYVYKDTTAMEASSNKKDKSRKELEEPEEEDEEQDNEEDDKDPDVEIEASQSNKGYKKRSKTQSDMQKKIYRGYKKYKDSEQQIDSQLQKMLSSAKSAFSGDKTEEILEGKKFSPIGLLKKVLSTAAIFNFSKVAGFAYLLFGHTMNKKRTTRQRKEIILELESEIKMLEEKIDDAKGDGNRKAKYALMRTKHELERTRDKIKFQLNATSKDISSAKSFLKGDKGRSLDKEG